MVVCGRTGSAPKQVGVASGVYEAHELAETVRAAEKARAAWQERSEIAERQREDWELRATTAERQREAWEERAHEAERQVGEAREQLATSAEEALRRRTRRQDSSRRCPGGSRGPSAGSARVFRSATAPLEHEHVLVRPRCDLRRTGPRASFGRTCSASQSGVM